ncbi:anthocyanidin 3-O-glucoside 2'''-O-xylosyltransferase-like [Silene latifolia]|uniref:anthocyanidin 3-O-glucoside 2'''-O-xylosyltransferase-like n=1 Tax=Silene latifolia TaxID=37657 RepID=UPI003D78A89E
MAEQQKKLRIVMYPWLAYGHMIPYMHLANHFAKSGHKITYIVPPKAKLRLQSLILYPSLITFRIITVPHVSPLPLGTENVTEVPELFQHTHLATAFDRTRPEFESIVTALRPDVVFYDLAYWVPLVAEQLEIKFKSVCYNVVSATCMNMIKYHSSSASATDQSAQLDLSVESSPSRFKEREIIDTLFGETLTFLERVQAILTYCDVISFRSCREVEGEDCDALSREYNKPVLLSGPMIPELDDQTELDPKWADWLGMFDEGSVVFCAFGSQFSLDKAQFQELLLGFEMTKLPFFLAVLPPKGCATVEEAFPEGFEERVGERGVVTGGWVQQQQILSHRSVGCFVNHCGFGTMWESLMSKNQIVLIPQLGDQVVNAKILAEKLKVGVEVERGDDGWVSKECLCKAILCVMDENDDVGSLVKKNHQIWSQILRAPGFMDDYIHKFIKDIEALADSQ